MAHWSSCAVNNAPALPVGQCDCGNDAPSEMPQPRARHTNWTSGQLSRLRQHYPTMPWEFLLAEFAPHPKRSIESTALNLGLRRNGKKWLAIAAEYKPSFAFGGPRV